MTYICKRLDYMDFSKALTKYYPEEAISEIWDYMNKMAEEDSEPIEFDVDDICKKFKYFANIQEYIDASDYYGEEMDVLYAKCESWEDIAELDDCEIVKCGSCSALLVEWS